MFNLKNLQDLSSFLSFIQKKWDHIEYLLNSNLTKLILKNSPLMAAKNILDPFTEDQVPLSQYSDGIRTGVQELTYMIENNNYEEETLTRASRAILGDDTNTLENDIFYQPYADTIGNMNYRNSDVADQEALKLHEGYSINNSELNILQMSARNQSSATFAFLVNRFGVRQSMGREVTLKEDKLGDVPFSSTLLALVSKYQE